MAFDQSGPRWLGISDLIAEPEGPTFISYKVARSRLNRLRFVTQDPYRKSSLARRMRQRLLAVAYQTSRRRGFAFVKMIRVVDRLRADAVPRGQGNI